LAQNVRTPFEVRGDLEAQFAANAVCEQRIGELVNRYSTKTIDRYLTELINYTERRLRSLIRTIPDGRYSFDDVIEGDGIVDRHYHIRVSLETQGDSLHADFSATDPAARGPINCRWPSVASCVNYVLKAILDPELPSNAGAYRPLKITVADGTILSARYPNAVCNANIITTQRIVDVLLGALSQAMPERVQAASCGTMNLLNVGGIDPKDGSYFQYIETYAGGQGAMHDSSGMDAVQNHMTNTRNAPVEAIEAAYPLRVEFYGLVADSEGPGRHRGGLGMQRALRVLGEEVKLTVSSDRANVPPWGLFGGGPGRTSSSHIVKRDGSTQQLPSKVTTFVDGGNLIITETPGGGGWGEAIERDASAVANDVSEGLISPARAQDIYRVAVIPETFALDKEGTDKLRY
jgi:N-methylhydantoinase B